MGAVFMRRRLTALYRRRGPPRENTLAPVLHHRLFPASRATAADPGVPPEQQRPEGRGGQGGRPAGRQLLRGRRLQAGLRLRGPGQPGGKGVEQVEGRGQAVEQQEHLGGGGQEGGVGKVKGDEVGVPAPK